MKQQQDLQIGSWENLVQVPAQSGLCDLTLGRPLPSLNPILSIQKGRGLVTQALITSVSWLGVYNTEDLG